VWNFKGYMNNSWHRVQFGMLWEDVKVAKARGPVLFVTPKVKKLALMRPA